MINKKIVTKKAVILLATLKATPALSNTKTLCDLLVEKLDAYNIESEIVRLADYHIEPGIETHATKGDDWPGLLKIILDADILIFATPIWWNSHSSLMQRVIERMDAVNDTLLETGISPFSNKVGGIVITGGRRWSSAHHRSTVQLYDLERINSATGCVAVLPWQSR